MPNRADFENNESGRLAWETIVAEPNCKECGGIAERIAVFDLIGESWYIPLCLKKPCFESMMKKLEAEIIRLERPEHHIVIGFNGSGRTQVVR